jgi:hypothetical protein
LSPFLVGSLKRDKGAGHASCGAAAAQYLSNSFVSLVKMLAHFFSQPAHIRLFKQTILW